MSFFIGFLVILGLFDPLGADPSYEKMMWEPYKWVDGRPVSCDLYLPADRSEPVPAVLYIHGGGWIIGWKRQYRDFAQELAAEGVAGVLVDFRLSPPGGYRDQIVDIKDAIRWVRANATEFGIDPDRIALFGSSSGAHLAGLAAFAGNGEGFGDDPAGTSSAVMGAVLVAGDYDFTQRHGFLGKPRNLSRVLGVEFGDDPGPYEDASPLHYVNGSEPPSLLIHGSSDNLVPPEQAHALADALLSVNVPAYVEILDGYDHALMKRLKVRRIVVDLIRGFVAETL